ncbi:MAG: acid--CoA ligase [Robiginitomaculum sp.]|nr:MAG: acid--CoA ligase [Robiginitomaculum sp.]
MNIANYDWIDFYARTLPGKTATIDIASNRSQTYAQMEKRVGHIAGYLLSQGIKPQDRVGVFAQNSTDILEIMFAIWRVGAVHLALNFRLTAKELSSILSNAEPVMVFADSDFDDVIKTLRTDTDADTDTDTIKWVSMDGLGNDTEFERIMTHAPYTNTNDVEKITTPDQQALLMYSSGTTGTPKGVMISHENIFYNATSGAFTLQTNRECVSYAVMPIFHIGSLMGFSLPALYAGGTAIIDRVFTPQAMLAAINNKEYGITHFLGLPAIFNALSLHPDCKTTDFSRIKAAVGGAESMPIALLNWWKDNAVPVLEVYGLTETTGLGCILLHEDLEHKIGSAGQAPLFSQFCILDEDGKERPRNTRGEICIKGANITSGYWRNPEATKAAFINGWFRTGDIGRMDDDGYIYIEDRLKDMYISGGENIYPAEIESILFAMPEIMEVSVIGVPDEKWGETGCAVVVLNAGHTLDIEQIKSFCAEKLASYKHPQHLVFSEALPRNATGKVLKFKLRQSIKI